jgi:hypothetical protein
MRERRVLCARLRFENTGNASASDVQLQILKLSARFGRFKCEKRLANRRETDETDARKKEIQTVEKQNRHTNAVSKNTEKEHSQCVFSDENVSSKTWRRSRENTKLSFAAPSPSRRAR